MGETALHVATAIGNLEVMSTLLAAKANPNFEDAIGERPLHYAALTGQTESARLLLQHGADPYAESLFRETALDVALNQACRFLEVTTDGVTALLRESVKRSA
eukprot:gnl/TRDRNA2_/TRDRNA2_170246_c1_seq1.p2 gnl/TRDRNA2_/TRDRNA2_170246_c1~~gnl/TRDRNA2_/TRDRNA2_170246_c1_seq1.p2  ORF type:complete len:110 (+),score=18.04 gnl/TRDRNA2_/TRDRNA2_170246_c1_seq1:22-330(+)